MFFKISGLENRKSALARIRAKILQQARSALGSEVRGLGRALRRLIPSNQPLGQLRSEWRRLENFATASSRPKQSSKIKVFVFRIFERFWSDFEARTRQNVVTLFWV